MISPHQLTVLHSSPKSSAHLRDPPLRPSADASSQRPQRPQRQTIAARSAIVCPSSVSRKVGRPPARWTDDLKKVAGGNWMRKAEDRVLWRKLGEAYVQQWTRIG
ncbi:hypothetical protein ACJJTC_002098 [Scirpophaga incertulas]